MPTIEISHKDLNSLVGKQLTVNQLKDEAILFAKGEMDGVNGDLIKVDIKDTNRPDLWSTEGIARELRGRYGKPGMPEYKTGKSGVVVHVDPKLKTIRPYTVCAVVRDIKITETVLAQMIQLQEKVSGTFGRNRREIAIGVYNASKIKPPIRFTTTSPTGLKFVPLESSRAMTPKEILEKHPKGREYGHLLKDKPAYPVFIDSAGEVLSIPPIINSGHTGKVTASTKEIFIECSGFDLKFLNTALNVIATALADRGGKVLTVDVYYGSRKITTPDISPRKTKANTDYIRKVAGISLSDKEIAALLSKALYKVKSSGKTLSLEYPAYRQDIMHQADVAEDVLISYGYNKIKPNPPALATTGSMLPMEKFSGKAQTLAIGAGLQEIMSYILTNKKELFDNMNLKPSGIVEIENPVSSNWSVFRTWLIPGLLSFFSQNMHREFPQKIFEIGDCVVQDPKQETRTADVKKLAVAVSDTSTGYEEISSIADFILSSLGVKYNFVRAEHPSFIKGRHASIMAAGREIGLIGEIHPQVLNNWKLEIPAAAFELDLAAIFSKIKT